MAPWSRMYLLISTFVSANDGWNGFTNPVQLLKSVAKKRIRLLLQSSSSDAADKDDHAEVSTYESTYVSAKKFLNKIHVFAQD
jgi:hypothetical protein